MNKQRSLSEKRNAPEEVKKARMLWVDRVGDRRC